YLRQQMQYGRAEALLERKWPAKYNQGGHLAWAGRVYAAANRRPGVFGRRRIRYGSWGENLFQSVYDRTPGTPGLLPLMPEWYLLIAVLAAMSAYDAVHDPLLYRLGGFPLAALFLAVSVSLLLTQGLRAGWVATHGPAVGRGERTRRAVLSGSLYVVQPLARLVGRLRLGLTPWRRRGILHVGVPLAVEHEIWSESWRSARERLLAIEARLGPECMAVSRGGECDRWDIHARVGPLAAARLRLTLEEHGQGRQLVRFRVWPRWSAGMAGLLAVLLALSAANLVAGDVLSGIVLGIGAVVLGGRGLREGGAAVASIVSAAVASEGGVDLPLTNPVVDVVAETPAGGTRRSGHEAAPDDLVTPPRERVSVGG
ncbi:MAG: hypothetical protein ABI927_08715, partial [Gaiellaceae bacterium]